MTQPINESTVEQATLEWLQELDYTILHGPAIAPGEPGAERSSFGDVLLAGRLQAALQALNPGLPATALEEAYRKLTRLDGPTLLQNNREFHRMLVDGVPVEYRTREGQVRGDLARIVDWADPLANDWVAVNQFTVKEGQHTRRPDIVLFINGLPIAVFELKNVAADPEILWEAHNQLQTYKQQIPSLFQYNELLVIGTGNQARIGSLTADRERFMPWRTINGEELAQGLELEVLTKGVFERRRLLDLLRHFILFHVDGPSITKIVAGYHQFHAVNSALQATFSAASPAGDRRAGVVWHTQGSGKSLTMAFYAGRVVLAPEMANPTLVIVTDRNDLDDQLFGTFAKSAELLRQTPVQAEGREDLRERLKVAAGGVLFTTIQKFLPGAKGDPFPLLSDRRNIVVIADEAHRSQYDFIDGFARHLRDGLPNASFIGFTGTPLESSDKNTRAVFGDYISVYDIQQAVVDGATVPIFYEARMARLGLDEALRPHLDQQFDEVTEGEEESRKERLKSKWAQLEAVVGTSERIELIAKDLVAHFEQRQESIDGKAMIVTMSRRIAVDLYDAIIRLRPEWHEEDDEQGVLKVVMTGSASDPLDWQPHIRSKARREALANRFKKAADPFKLVIVRDMWLTGFDAPCMHTIYIDKPMRGHGLMQAIARVNRVFKDKPGGLVVDYLGLAEQLKAALATYTSAGGKGQTAIDQAEAVAILLEKYEVCQDLFHGFDYTAAVHGTGAAQLAAFAAALEFLLAKRPERGPERFSEAVTALSQAFALAVPHEAALAIRDEVGFFQRVKAALAGTGRRGGPNGPGDLDQAIRQIVSRAVAAQGVVDIFQAAGLDRPDLSILSDEFLAEVKAMPQKNLALEALRRLLEGEIAARLRQNVVQQRSFAEKLQAAVRAYLNRSISSAEVIAHLIEMAKELRGAHSRGEQLGLTTEELAFYDALGVNDSAVQVLGDEALRFIAQELTRTVRQNLSIDWNVKESARAKLRVLVKRLLRQYGYPPDKTEVATRTVLEQAEQLCFEWMA